MNIPTEPYLAQQARWPSSGRHILAHFDAGTVVVYQAYRPAIAQFALKHGYFGGDFSYERMSWIKPNFLWMMYRCGWATKPGQEMVLGIRLQRTAFNAILSQAVHSTFVPGLYGDHDEWQRSVARSSVRLQWDPDHSPSGAPVERRAVQLGLRGPVLGQFGKEWIASIEDMTPLVQEQRDHARPPYTDLLVPAESVYPVDDPETAKRLQLE